MNLDLNHPQSKLILGSMRWGSWGAQHSPQSLNRFLHQVSELGFRRIDLADIYGDHSTTTLIGAALRLSPGLSARFAWIAKGGIVMPSSPGNFIQGRPDRPGPQYYNASSEHLRRVLDATRSALGVARLERFLLHRIDYLIQVDALAEFARSAIAGGDIAAFGLSNASAAQLQLVDRHVPLSSNQIEFALTHNIALDGMLQHCQARNIEIQAYSPLKDLANIGAELADELDRVGAEYGLTSAQVLLRWLSSIPGVQVVIGSTRLERLQEAITACDTDFDRVAWYRLLSAARGSAMP